MNKDVLRRIAIVKQLYGAATESAQRPNPANALAILPLHDAVEMFMQLSVEYKNVTITKKADFDQYWTALEASNIRLSSREGMRRLNSARVSLKHNGLLPDRDEIAGFVNMVTNFLIDSCQVVFGVDWKSVSLGFLINDARLREMVEKAKTAIQQGNAAIALEQLKIAFDLAIACRSHDDLYDPRQRISSINFFNFGVSAGIGGDKTAKALRELSDTFGEALMVVGYKLDFDGYRQLKTYSPVVHHMLGGAQQIEWMFEPTNDFQIIERCADFVVDTCLRLQVLS